MREGLRRYLVTILVAFVTASVAAGGTAFAILVNADRVDGYHANQLIRMARSSANANALVGTDGVIRRVKIVAPRSGFLFILGRVRKRHGHERVLHRSRRHRVDLERA